MTSIGSYAFSGCSGLEAVYIKDIAKWCEISFGYAANPLYNAHSLYLNGELVTDLVIPNSVTSIVRYAFEGCSELKSVYYKGTASDWTKIFIGSYNSNLISATRYYYSEEEPTDDGNYWHYDENGTIVVWAKK